VNNYLLIIINESGKKSNSIYNNIIIVNYRIDMSKKTMKINIDKKKNTQKINIIKNHIKLMNHQQKKLKI